MHHNLRGGYVLTEGKRDSERNAHLYMPNPSVCVLRRGGALGMQVLGMGREEA